MKVRRSTHQLVGDYKNSGSDYRPEGCPDKVNVHDFVDKELGKAIPYGVYDISANAGYVSVGIDHDTYVDGTLLARAFGSVLIRSLASICPACCRART